MGERLSKFLVGLRMMVAARGGRLGMRERAGDAHNNLPTTM